MPQRRCHVCCVGVAGAAWKLKDDFSASEWKSTIDPNCKVCMARRREENTPYRCTRCREWRAAADFAETSIHDGMSRRVFKPCTSIVVNSCATCRLERPKDAFTKSAWKQATSLRKCNMCMEGDIVALAASEVTGIPSPQRSGTCLTTRAGV